MSSTRPQWQPCNLVSLGRRPLHSTPLLFDESASQESTHDTAAKTTGAGIDSAETHYGTLNVPPHASTSEIKKSFYRLSKHHHPDHNTEDPRAPRRFMKLSEAYSVLSSAEKKAAYDRSLARLHSSGHGHHGHDGHYGRHGHKGGSYQGGSNVRYAGGRPATGLSKKRGQFQGPPPSFFRSGGWGRHTERRQEHHEESTRTWGGQWKGNMPYGHNVDGSNSSSASASSSGDYTARRENENSWAGTSWSAARGIGPEANPFIYEERETYGARHFDASAHEKRQRRVAESILHSSRRRSGMPVGEVPKNDIYAGLLTNFLIVTAILMLMVAVPGFAGRWTEVWNTGARKDAADPRISSMKRQPQQQQQEGRNQREGRLVSSES